MNEYKPLKLDNPTVPAQGTAFATKGNETKKKSGNKGAAAGGKYLKAAEWNALSSDEQQKIIESWSKSKGDDDDKSTSSSNGFPRKGGPKLYSPGEIMTDRRLHADDLRLGFGTLPSG